MTNLNAKNFISLYVTRVNSLNNAIFKDLENGKESHTFKACVELTTLSNEELYEIGYKSLFEFKTNSKGKKVLVKKRIYRNDTSAYKSVIENIDKIVEFAKTKEAKTSKVNQIRGVIAKTNAHFNPKPSQEKSQVVTSEEVAEVSEVAETTKRTKSETLKNFADIWLKEHNEDLLAMIEFAMSEEGAKISDYSVEQKSKVA